MTGSFTSNLITQKIIHQMKLLKILSISLILFSVNSYGQLLEGNLVSISDLFSEVKIEMDTSDIGYMVLNDAEYRSYLILPKTAEIFSDSIIFNEDASVYILTSHYNQVEELFDSSTKATRVMYQLNHDNSVHWINYVPVGIKVESMESEKEGYILNYYGSKYPIEFHIIDSFEAIWAEE